jgi:hypothetical protein
MGEKTEKGAPKRLDTWRITSPTKGLIEQAAGLYGGEPKPWDSPTGQQWEVVTTSAELPVLVMPGYSFRQGYEYRTSPTLVERRCDGVEMDDGRPCLCNAEGEDKCALLTRLTVALPELTTMLGWRLETKGDNAARELLASMDLVQGIAGGRPFVPAKLRIVERRGNKNGQAVRYVVPVIDVSVRYAEVLGGEMTPRERAALPAGYTPIPERVFGTSLEEGLQAAETQQLTRKPRVSLVEDDEILDDESGASVPGSDGAADQPTDASPADAPAPLKPTPGQKKKIGVHIAQLRDGRGLVTTEQLWANLAKARERDVEFLILGLNGRDEEGVLHFGPLLESLTREEASRLIDWFEKVEAKAGASA